MTKELCCQVNPEQGCCNCIEFLCNDHALPERKCTAVVKTGNMQAAGCCFHASAAFNPKGLAMRRSIAQGKI